MNDKYPRTPLCPWSPGGAHEGRPPADMRDYAGTAICVTEKIDGANVMIRRGQAYPRSADATAAAPWLAMCRKHIAWRSLEVPSLTLYGEDIYGVHAIEYDPVDEDRTFRLFAVLEEDHWARWDRVEEIAARLDIATVPVLFRGQYRDIDAMRARLLELMAGPSALGGEQEGIVIRRDHEFAAAAFTNHVCKMVRAGHVQPNEEHWSRRWRTARTFKPAQRT